MDVLDVLVSTKDVEGVSVEHASNPIEGSFAPAKLESGLFIIREGSICGSEDLVKPRAAVRRVDSVRFESDDVRSRRGRVVVCVALDDREKAGGCGVDQREGGSQKHGNVCKEHREELGLLVVGRMGVVREEKKGKRRVKARGVEGIVKDREGLVGNGEEEEGVKEIGGNVKESGGGRKVVVTATSCLPRTTF